jgi:preprotein translocase subunit SecD
MKKRYRFLIILAVIAVGFYFVWPSIRWYFLTPQTEKDVAESSRNQIKVYAQERADTAIKALEALIPASASAPVPQQYSFMIDKARVRYRNAGKAVPAVWTVKDVLSAYTSRDDAAADAEGWYRTGMLDLKDMKNQTMQLGLDLRGGMYVTTQLDYASYEKTTGTRLSQADRDDKMKQVMEVLRNKIDQFGLADPSLRPVGNDRIIIELPGTSDPEAVRRFIQGKGTLEFHLVDEDGFTKVKQYQADHPGVLLDAAGNVKDTGVLAVVPKGSSIRGVFQKDSYGLDELKGYTVLFDEVAVNGTEVKSATVGRDQVGNLAVNFTLTTAGGDAMYKFSSVNVGKRMAVTLDGKVKNDPATIRDTLRDQIQITGGGMSTDEANDLALTLRTGSLPVPIEITSQQAIGASLGQDAISQGIKASVIGIGLVMIFMLLYYRRAGLNAVISQILHLYINVAILSVFGFTLTLAAIAGLVLTIGMAVDANVLIFERMKEESRLGKTVQAVVGHGFSRAFSAILDSNVTTIIAALVLTNLGKGSIQGFAVTLLVGNLATLFAAVFVSRLIFDFELDVLHTKRFRLTWRRIA